MNEIEIIRAINSASQENYVPKFNKNEHETYLENCNWKLFEFLISFLGESYLFSALTYKHHSKKIFDIVKVPTDSSKINYNFYNGVTEDEKKAVKDLLEDASNEVTINLTHSLLSKKPGQDLFFCAGTKKYGNDILSSTSSIIQYDLSKVKFDSDYSQFKKINSSCIQNFIDKLALKEDYDFDKYGKYLQHYKNIELKYKSTHPDKDFYVHLIRPSIIDLDFNLLLSLATNIPLGQGQLAFINLLIYRIVSQTAIEKVLEAEKKAFSLTTHSFKTELNTTLIPQVNLIKKEIQGESKNWDKRLLEKYVEELDEQSNDLKNLTGIITLIDKLDSEDEFIESGQKDFLITDKPNSLTIEKRSLEYIYRNPTSPKILVSGNGSTLPLNIKVFKHFLSETIIKLFYDNLFENIKQHGKRVNNQLSLLVEKNEHTWTFTNELKVERFTIDPKKLRGNLLFFKTIIEQSDSGNLEIEIENNMFKIYLYQL